MRHFSYEKLCSKKHTDRFIKNGFSIVDNIRWLHANWRRCVFNLDTNKDFLETCTPLRKLYNSWHGRPSIVVGAGPSARINMENIKKVQEQGAKVIAVDKIFKTLKDNGIRPDMTLTLDNQECVAAFFPKEYVESDDIICPNVYSSPMVYEAISEARIFPMATFSPLDKTMIDFDKKILQSKYGTKFHAGYGRTVVGANALEVTMWMGCRHILHIGNDLCYYSKQDLFNSFNKDEQELAAAEYIEVIQDKMILHTTRAFMQAKSQFNMLLLQFPDGDMVKQEDAPLWIDCSLGLKSNFPRVGIEQIIEMNERGVTDENQVDDCGNILDDVPAVACAC